MIPVALYLRMSDPKQEASLPDQRKACVKYAKSHGLRIVCEYVDEGISGDDTGKRVAFQRMIADSASGKFAGILCWDQDRFGRFDGIEAGFWIKPLRDRGIFLETISQGRIDWNDFAGRIVYSIQQESKHAYLRDLSRNVNRGMLSAALEGKPLGALPRGYVVVDGQVSVSEPDAEVIREIYRLYLDGLSCREVACELNARGIRPAKASQWTRTTIYQALTNEYYTGAYRWNATGEGKYSEVRNGAVVPIRSGNGKLRQKDDDDAVRIDRHHPAIIDKTTFDRVQRLLSENRRHTFRRSGGSAFALSGLLTCAACGSAMHGRHRGRDGKPYYVCSRSLHSTGCRSHSVLESELLERILTCLHENLSSQEFIKYATASLKRRLDAPKQGGKALDSRLAALRSKIDKAKVRLTECDRDLLPIVQTQLRKVMQEEATLAQEAARRTDARKDAESIIPRIQSILGQIGRLIGHAGEVPAGELRRYLSGLIETVKVTSATDPAHRSRFILKSAEIRLKIGAVLHTAASPLRQDCAKKTP